MYLNIKCNITLINKGFILQQNPHIEIKKLSFLLLIKNLNIIKYIINKYLIINLYFLIKDNKFIWLYKELHIVNNLKIKLLIRINNLSFKEIIINLLQNKTYIKLYNINIAITLSSK